MYINSADDQAITREEAIKAIMKEDERLSREQAESYLKKVESGSTTIEIGPADIEGKIAYLWLPVTAEEYENINEKAVFMEDAPDGGRRKTFGELMADNAGDHKLWDWALLAKVGDKTTDGKTIRIE